MISADCVISNCEQLLTCRGPLPKRREALQDVGCISNGFIASQKGEIVFVGTEDDYRKIVQPEKDCLHIDGHGLVGLPGLVDPHTHLPFAGSREDEFLLRVKGYTYQQLAAQGLGIQTTVKATRAASAEILHSLCLSRLDSMLCHGTTTVEAKSGYGLNFEDELKQLRVLKNVHHSHPVDIVSTFMGAHEVPLEFKTRKKEYMDLIIDKMLPEVTGSHLAEFFDVFCEQGVYSIDETRVLIQAAKRAGLKIKIHADEFVSLGGAQLAAEEKATSAEHLIAISDEGITALAESGTAAILLPGVSFFLMQEKKAPARKLIDRDAIVALASDFNPGSSMTESMIFIFQLAVFTLKMHVEEAINAATANAAYAISRHEKVGSLEVGKEMDVVLCQASNYATLVYHFGINPVQHVLKKGRLVVKDGQRIKD
jgi:imidazolonepropionase